jgi:hypothetical protein
MTTLTNDESSSDAWADEFLNGLQTDPVLRTPVRDRFVKHCAHLDQEISQMLEETTWLLLRAVGPRITKSDVTRLAIKRFAWTVRAALRETE